MRVISFRVPPFDNAVHILVDERRDAIVIDPSMAEREIMRALRDEGLRLLAILNTHGHNDHIYGNAAVKEATRARLAIHRLDAYRLDSATSPGTSPETRAMVGSLIEDVPPATADDLLDEGPIGYLADVDVQALHTPGHTEGSTSFHLPAEHMLFTGDLLFAGNIGRADLPGGDVGQMMESLRRVADLPPETRVYPGHGPTTTLADELPWLRDLSVPPGVALR